MIDATIVEAPALPLPPIVQTEIRCPACVPLGWERPRLLLTVFGVMESSTVKVQCHCPRCKSLVKWTYGTAELEIVKHGPIEKSRQKAIYENVT